MERWAVVLLISTLALALPILGCEEDRRTWFIRRNQVFTGDPPECVVADDETSPFRTVGTLDTMLRDNYILNPLIENQMMVREDLAHLRNEPNGIQVEGATVRVWCDSQLDGDGDVRDPDFPEFFSPAPSYVPPEALGVSSLVVVHAGIVADLGAVCGTGRQLLMVGVRMNGVSNGGLVLETPEFFYPIFTCDGCLYACTADANDEDIAGQDCCSTDPPTQIPCAGGQDDAVDCRLAPRFVDLCGPLC